MIKTAKNVFPKEDVNLECLIPNKTKGDTN